MSFNVQSFRSQMVLDGARPNLFECRLTFPLIGDAAGVAEKYTFMARAAQLPGSTVNQVPVNYFGRELKFAGNRTFPEWTVTVINDEDFMVRKAFERWMSGMNSHVGNRRIESFAKGDGGYQQDGSVNQFGKTGGIIKAYRFVGMFPIDLSPIDLDWGANDTIEEYSVTFAYQWWESTRDTVTDGFSVSPPTRAFDR